MAALSPAAAQEPPQECVTAPSQNRSLHLATLQHRFQKVNWFENVIASVLNSYWFENAIEMSFQKDSYHMNHKTKNQSATESFAYKSISGFEIRNTNSKNRDKAFPLPRLLPMLTFQGCWQHYQNHTCTQWGPAHRQLTPAATGDSQQCFLQITLAISSASH